MIGGTISKQALEAEPNIQPGSVLLLEKVIFTIECENHESEYIAMMSDSTCSECRSQFYGSHPSDPCIIYVLPWTTLCK